MSQNDRQNWQVLLATLALTGGSSVLWLFARGLSDDSLRLALRLTADLAFVLYIVVIVARPLQQLLRRQWSARLLRNRRLVGVAFAATMTTHLGMIIYRFGSQPDLEFRFDPLGAGAFAVFYLMLITSFDAPKKAIGPKAWKILHRTGLIIAAYIFVVPHPLEAVLEPDYLKFGIPFAIALGIRITAWRQSRRRDS